MLLNYLSHGGALSLFLSMPLNVMPNPEAVNTSAAGDGDLQTATSQRRNWLLL